MDEFYPLKQYKAAMLIIICWNELPIEAMKINSPYKYKF
jgi:hypothetical protein